PSGQGFFISYSNSGFVDSTSTNGDGDLISQGTITFSNSMRVTGNNTQFFKNSNSKESSVFNKLWVNLTSDNGIFNQILVAYVNGATDDFDGLTYDAPRNLSTGVYSILYSIIENNDKKFAIQGKDPSSLDLDETIVLGFDTSIDVATLYKLSVAQIEGNFFNDNTVYLKDNLMNTIHNLSKSDYTFTSEVGKFKDRFEIVFTDASLGTDQNNLEANNVSIIDLDEDNVKFKASNNLTILNVQLFDVLGRQLYDFKGSNNVEIYNISALSQATYIAKIELSNGAIVSKKAVKK
ncbi:MAG TPA: T9SS type A sorting domain-containing protein, partial [Flavobacteriaceae bacterium]|nr:T9SS type A sorting domain-containing protein [Flavobacteriaceae bacterium]